MTYYLALICDTLKILPYANKWLLSMVDMSFHLNKNKVHLLNLPQYKLVLQFFWEYSIVKTTTY